MSQAVVSETASPSSAETGLKKEIRWWDGVVITAAMPGFLLVSIGFSVGLLGGWGALAMWIGVVTFGFLLANLYAEMAAAFPHRAGGIATYIDEAVHKISRIPAVVSAYGYWFGYSTVLSINGLLIGLAIQAAWLPNVHVYLTSAKIDIFPPLVGSVMLIVVWAVAIAGIRPTVWVTYLLGILTMVPLALVAIVPWFTGHMHLENLNNTNFPGLGASGTASPVVIFSLAGLGLFLAMWYLAGWSAYAVECAAAFTPEYKYPQRETPKALRVAGLAQIAIFTLVVVALVGTIGQAKITAAPYVAFVPVLQTLFGNVGSTLVLIMLLSSLVLSALISTADGGRALYQLARDGLTIKWLGHLNERGVPDNGMTWDLGIQGVLMWIPFAAGVLGGLISRDFSGFATNAPIVILAVSNLGYITSHVLATASFLILRRRRPDLVRPFKLNSAWVPAAWFLLAFNIVIIVLGAANPTLGYGITPFLLGVVVLLISVVLYFVRRNLEEPRVGTGTKPPVAPVAAGRA
jgi:amino acid transporter